jgi:hypothetical protein
VIDTRLGGQVVRHAPPCPDLLRTEVTQSSQESKAGQYCPPKLPKVINRQEEILLLPQTPDLRVSVDGPQHA